MKIAVYTIALNEEKHVKQWYESAKAADLLVIADTGSTDKTRYLAKSLGISVTEIEVKPWRFDVARNASLALIPEDFDICIQLDMDEILPEGWRKKVEEAFAQGNTWPIYKHVTGRDPEGKPRNYQHYFKIHPRKGFYWKYPIHEVLVHLPELHFERELIDLEVDHMRDSSKSRKSYLDLLEKAVEEEPTDWRMNHYLNREYFYNRDWLKVLQSAYQCEMISGGWDVERASTYMWASEAAHHLKMPSLAEDWARKATDAAPHFYEVWHWRSHIAHLNKKWSDCFEYASKRLSLERQGHHLVKPEVWEWWGYDLMALSNHKLGLHSEAIKYGDLALNNNPSNDRLRKNLQFYQTSNLELERISHETPLILWAVLAKDASKNLPLYLECLLSQDYPKKSIGLYIRTNDNNDDTEARLKKFIDEYGTMFREIVFDSTNIDESIKVFSQHEWNSKRFRILGKIRQASLDYARFNSYDYYFCSDTDNFLLPHTLSNLVRLELPIVAPMLRVVVPEKVTTNVENKNSSNFYFTDDQLYFRECQEYYSILNRETPGVHSVPLIHCTYLIKSELFPKIDYRFGVDEWEYKNLVHSLREAKAELFLDNRVEYGNLTLSSAVEQARFQLKGLSLENVSSEADSVLTKKFNQIYALSEWGFRSGPGSDPEFARPFIDKINDYLDRDDISSILDIGCGDFRIGQNYKIGSKSYTGLDVSSLIIEENRRFENASINFMHGDFETLQCDRSWDLIIIKDVLQHLPNTSVINVLNKIERYCKIAIICNDLSESNFDIVPGGYRKLNLGAAPFNRNYEVIMDFQGKRVLEYNSNKLDS
jgi:hypothetical protein